MHDLVIRRATLVDGTGAPRRIADLAVDGGLIAAVGDGIGPGRREIHADGLLLTPGWVDIHTHYDGQATWDPYVTPSSLHGVTTAVFGNCGVGFAPVRPGSSPRAASGSSPNGWRTRCGPISRPMSPPPASRGRRRTTGCSTSGRNTVP